MMPASRMLFSSLATSCTVLMVAGSPDRGKAALARRGARRPRPGAGPLRAPLAGSGGDLGARLPRWSGPLPSATSTRRRSLPTRSPTRCAKTRAFRPSCGAWAWSRGGSPEWASAEASRADAETIAKYRDPAWGLGWDPMPRMPEREQYSRRAAAACYAR